jgi:hypothetical protein
MPTLLLLAALSLQAQSTVRISGSVTDETALPLPGAVIELNGRVVAISDERGSFELAATLETLARIRIALDGFEARPSIQASPGSTSCLPCVDSKTA